MLSKLIQPFFHMGHVAPCGSMWLLRRAMWRAILLYISSFFFTQSDSKTKMKNPSTVALHNTNTRTPLDLPSASISLFNHTDGLPPLSFKPPTANPSHSTSRRSPSTSFFLAPHPPASHFETASGVTKEDFTGA